MKTAQYDSHFHTIHEQLVIAEIKVKARRHELRLLRAAKRKGLLPDVTTVCRRIMAATIDKACRDAG
ncbi:MAG: hypothetical protein H0W34_00965 [Pyrinomonadaceae bacterium]|nr:hypothetical protein [Pyrinomonadaceae bacterium]